MKTLYLARHAKSSWKFSKFSDHDRPLNKRGKRNAPEMGQRLQQHGILPDSLVSSTAVRASKTAQAIAEAIGYPAIDIHYTHDLYHSDEQEILEVIQSTEDKHQSLMLFGHNPGFTWATNSLTNIGIDNVPTCGIVAINFEVNSWSEVDFGKGKLDFFDYPKHNSHD